jgi:hypothetical protein
MATGSVSAQRFLARPRQTLAVRTDPALDAWPHTTRVLPWCLAGVLVMLWMVPFSNIAAPIALPVDATLDWPLVAAVVALWLATLGLAPSSWRPSLRISRVHVGIGCLFVAAVASVALNAEVLANLRELSVATKTVLELALYALLFVVVASVVRPSEVPGFVTLLLALATICALATIFEYRFESNPFYDWTSSIFGTSVLVPDDLHLIDYSGRKTVYGPMGHPLELALTLGLALPFALVRLLDASERAARIGYGLLAGAILAGIFSTERKTGMIGAGVAIVVLVAYRRPPLRQLVAMGIGLLLMLHLLAPGAAGSLKQQFQPDRVTATNSTQHRENDYTAVLPDILTHPALGRGFGSYDSLKYRVIDNEYLSLLIAVGAVGTAAYLLMMFLGGAAAHRVARRRDDPLAPMAQAAVGAIASFAVASVLFDVLAFAHVSYVFFFVLGLVAVLSRPRAPAGVA